MTSPTYLFIVALLFCIMALSFKTQPARTLAWVCCGGALALAAWFQFGR